MTNHNTERFNEIKNRYPKIRPPLSQEYQDIYEEHYVENRSAQNGIITLAGKLEEWMHKNVANIENDNPAILEIGAGTLNHIKFEPTFKSYDIIEPFKILFENSPILEKINNVYRDVREIHDKKYDKICSVAVFEHLEELPLVVAKLALLLNQDGVLCFGIPSEGTILWKLGYTLTTGIQFKRKYGLKYSTMMHHEHVNTAKEIEIVVKYLFKNVTSKSFGLCKGLSLYQYYECTGSNSQIIQETIDYYENK